MKPVQSAASKGDNQRDRTERQDRDAKQGRETGVQITCKTDVQNRYKNRNTKDRYKIDTEALKSYDARICVKTGTKNATRGRPRWLSV